MVLVPCVGAQALLAKSFAHTHEPNLTKQGVLALTLDTVEDYDHIKDGE